jgi:hypothetical protein
MRLHISHHSQYAPVVVLADMWPRLQVFASLVGHTQPATKAWPPHVESTVCNVPDNDASHDILRRAGLRVNYVVTGAELHLYTSVTVPVRCS